MIGDGGVSFKDKNALGMCALVCVFIYSHMCVYAFVHVFVHLFVQIYECVCDFGGVIVSHKMVLVS